MFFPPRGIIYIIRDGSRRNSRFMDLWNEFHGSNAAYVLDLFDRYQHDPASVNPQVRAFFDRLSAEQRAELAGRLAAPAETGRAAAAPAPPALDPVKYAAANSL